MTEAASAEEKPSGPLAVRAACALAAVAAPDAAADEAWRAWPDSRGCWWCKADGEGSGGSPRKLEPREAPGWAWGVGRRGKGRESNVNGGVAGLRGDMRARGCLPGNWPCDSSSCCCCSGGEALVEGPANRRGGPCSGPRLLLREGGAAEEAAEGADEEGESTKVEAAEAGGCTSGLVDDSEVDGKIRSEFLAPVPVVVVAALALAWLRVRVRAPPLVVSSNSRVQPASLPPRWLLLRTEASGQGSPSAESELLWAEGCFCRQEPPTAAAAASGTPSAVDAAADEGASTGTEEDIPPHRGLLGLRRPFASAATTVPAAAPADDPPADAQLTGPPGRETFFRKVSERLDAALMEH
jgi:hypothetical protein